MNFNHLKLCAWAGPVFVLLMLSGYLLAGFLPPTDPLASAETVAQFYRDNLMSIRSGLVVMVFGAAFYAPFMSAVIEQMKRMGNPSPVMIQCFAFICAAVTLGLFVILVPWGAASFRPERMPEITRAFNDYSFIFLLWPGTLMPVSYIALGLAVLSDTRSIKVFPRWFAFYNFWSALLSLVGCFLLFFKAGPFAWNGLFAFWINIGVFFAWFIVMAVVLLLSVWREEGISMPVSTTCTEASF